MLNNTTQERIEKEAREYTHMYPAHFDGYKLGATKEALRAQQLEEALKKIQDISMKESGYEGKWMAMLTKIRNIIEEVLN